MSEGLGIALFVGACLLCLGGVVAGGVALTCWGLRARRRHEEALKAAGFEPVTALAPELARRLLALSQYDEQTHEAVCRHARREAGYTILLQGCEARDEVLAEWQLGPAVHAPGLGMPRLTLFPRTVVGERLTRWAIRAVAWRSGGVLRPVAFPEDPAFESLFEVLGADEAAVRGCLDSNRRAWLAGMRGLTLAGEGDLFTFERYVQGHPSTTHDDWWFRSVVEDARTLVGILWVDGIEAGGAPGTEQGP